MIKYYCDRCGKEGDFTRKDKESRGIGDRYNSAPLVKLGLLTYNACGPCITPYTEICKACYEDFRVWSKK